MRPIGAAGVVLLAGLSAARVSGAQPSLWDVARDPSSAEAYGALLQAEDHLAQAAETDGYGARWRMHLRAAMAVLSQRADGPDPRVRFLLAEVLTEVGGAWHREIRDLLQPALEQTRDPGQAAEGWYQLALAAARLGDRELEVNAYERALELTWKPGVRGNILYNRGDAKMGLGQLREAVRDFEDAIATARDVHTQALAFYGLGITLERSGDLPSGLAAFERGLALQASSQIPSVLDDPRVFFVPDYDLYYYKALESMAEADRESDAEAKVVDLQSAAVFWNRYLFGAELDRHRWVPNARHNLAKCERDAERLAHPRKSRTSRRARR